MCGDQSITQRSWFSPYTMESPGIEDKSSGLAADAFV